MSSSVDLLCSFNEMPSCQFSSIHPVSSIPPSLKATAPPSLPNQKRLDSPRPGASPLSRTVATVTSIPWIHDCNLTIEPQSLHLKALNPKTSAASPPLDSTKLEANPLTTEPTVAAGCYHGVDLHLRRGLDSLTEKSSTYSELQAARGADQLPLVDNFFSLQDDLGHTQPIIELYANNNLLRAKDSNPKGPGSIRECLKLTLDRKKNATTWIRAALVFNLTLFSANGIPKTTTNVE
ncbi:hypothetical protein F2P56_009348, partial [Juglans regia]